MIRLALRIGLPFVGFAAAWQHWIWLLCAAAAAWVLVAWTSDEIVIVDVEADDE